MKPTSLMMVLLLALGSSLPIAAQWDLRLEIPAATSKDLPSVLVGGATELSKGTFDTGKGYIASVSRNLIDLGLITLEGNIEYSRLNTKGTYAPPNIAAVISEIGQEGIGAGLNVQVWVPFFGVAAEFGLLQRWQSYEAILGVAKKKEYISRKWIRVGGRWNVPFLPLDAYVCGSFQQPLDPKNPVQIQNAQSLLNLLETQGSGQEFDRLWTFGVGFRF